MYLQKIWLNTHQPDPPSLYVILVNYTVLCIRPSINALPCFNKVDCLNYLNCVNIDIEAAYLLMAMLHIAIRGGGATGKSHSVMEAPFKRLGRLIGEKYCQ